MSDNFFGERERSDIRVCGATFENIERFSRLMSDFREYGAIFEIEERLREYGATFEIDE